MTETTESLSDAPPRPSTPRDRRMAPFIAVAMSIIVGVHLFVGWRLFGTLGLETPSGALAWGVLALSAALIPSGLLGRFFLRPALADGLSLRVGWIGTLALCILLAPMQWHGRRMNGTHATFYLPRLALAAAMKPRR